MYIPLYSLPYALRETRWRLKLKSTKMKTPRGADAIMNTKHYLALHASACVNFR